MENRAHQPPQETEDPDPLRQDNDDYESDKLAFENYQEEEEVMMAKKNVKVEDDCQGEKLMTPLVTSEAPEPKEPQFGNDPIERIAMAYFPESPEFFASAIRFAFCFLGLQASYLLWGYMQELIMTTTFNPTPSAPDGKFPSAAFCVFSNRFLAVIVAMIAVKRRHGSVFGNNKAPLLAFTPCALSNTCSSWSQYASLKFVSFPVQTVFKSSKIIPVMLMGKVLKGTIYPYIQYFEAFLITVGVAVFSVFGGKSKEGDDDTTTELKGLLFLLCYICSDSFTSQWQSRLYQNYGKESIDPYQMMLGVNISAITITTIGLIVTSDYLRVIEFLTINPQVLSYNIVTAITSATGQLFIFYTIKEFGPIVFTIIMTTRQMFSIVISAIIFHHIISIKALIGAVLVFGVLFWQIRRKYIAKGRVVKPIGLINKDGQPEKQDVETAVTGEAVKEEPK